jgi:hypothetical protein
LRLDNQIAICKRPAEPGASFYAFWVLPFSFSSTSGLNVTKNICDLTDECTQLARKTTQAPNARINKSVKNLNSWLAALGGACSLKQAPLCRLTNDSESIENLAIIEYLLSRHFSAQATMELAAQGFRGAEGALSTHILPLLSFLERYQHLHKHFLALIIDKRHVFSISDNSQNVTYSCEFQVFFMQSTKYSVLCSNSARSSMTMIKFAPLQHIKNIKRRR